MLKPSQIITLAVVLLHLFNSCSKSTKNETKDPDPISSLIEGTPKENEEAELIALCLSGELVAPDDLYEQVLTDLATIRTKFSDSLEAIGQIQFRTPWAAGHLMIGFKDTTVVSIRNGEYHAWDQLNELYGVETIDTSIIYIMGIVTLHFKGRLHPYRLQEAYAGLAGAWAISVSGTIGDGANVYARQGEHGMTYLFRNGWGDCPAGCINNEYWYFVFSESNLYYHGHFVVRQDTVPDWWEDARQNRENYCTN
jgi:hypothetical protein